MSPRARACAVVVLLCTAAACAAPQQPAPQTAAPTTVTGADAPVTVARVIDGDTIVLADETRVRLIGVDTPETGQCYGAAATEYVRARLPQGAQVLLQADPTQDDTDRYGRWLRYVQVPAAGAAAQDSTDLGGALIAGGYAREYTYDSRRPAQRQGEYRAAQDAARAAGAGGWDDCGWVF